MTLNGTDLDHGFRRSGGPFVIFAVAARAAVPGIRAFNHPAFADHAEALRACGRRLHLDAPLRPMSGQPGVQRVVVIFVVAEDHRRPRQLFGRHGDRDCLRDRRLRLPVAIWRRLAQAISEPVLVSDTCRHESGAGIAASIPQRRSLQGDSEPDSRNDVQPLPGDSSSRQNSARHRHQVPSLPEDFQSDRSRSSHEF